MYLKYPQLVSEVPAAETPCRSVGDMASTSSASLVFRFIAFRCKLQETAIQDDDVSVLER